MHTRLLSSKERLDWLRLYRSENIGPKTFFDLIAIYRSAGVALERIQEMSLKGGRKKPIALCSAKAAAEEMAAHEKMGAVLLAHCEPEFPKLLREIKDCPPIISVLGNRSLMERQTIAIVGARNASANGCHFAHMLARELGTSNVVCVSGLARGIDTAVHKGSLATGTIAVIGGGINTVYPKENAALQQAITEQGLVIAESPFGAQPVSQSFPRRNRIISGLSYGTVVVEAAYNSGSLITARMAADQGRDVYAVPGSPLDPRCRGTNDLIRQGATLTESAKDILGHTNFVRDVAPFNLNEPESNNYGGATVKMDEMLLNNIRPRVHEKLSATPVPIDEIISQLGISPSLVLTVLLELELAGRLERHAGNCVALLYSGQMEDVFTFA